MMGQLLSLIIWYLLSFYGGVFGTLVLSSLFKKPFEYFYGIGRVFWLLLFGYILWLGASLKIIPFTSGFLWSILVFLSLCILLFFYRNYSSGFKSGLKSMLSKEVILSELLYLIAFILFATYLAHFSEYTRTEDYMNLGIFSVLLKTSFLPPKDVWMSSFDVNYYYFGHFLYSIYLKMLNIKLNTGMSIALIGLFSNSVVSAFWLFRKLKLSVIFSTLGVYFLLLSGNLYLWKALLINKSFGTEDFNFASKLIDGGVAYIPVYTFFLGGFHANVINLSHITLLFVFLLLLILASSREEHNNSQHGISLKVTFTHLFLVAFVLGAIFTTNTWDIIVSGVLIFLALSIVYGVFRAFLYSILVLIMSLILFLPYHLSFMPSGFFGVSIPSETLDISTIVIMFGVFLSIYFLYLLYKVALERRFSKVESYILIIGTLGCILAFVPKYLVFRDLLYIDNPKLYRSNTFYKFWYESWIFFSVFSAYVLFGILKRFRLGIKVTILIILLLVTGIYPGYLTVSQISGIFKGSVSADLDGMSYLKEADSDTYFAIKYLYNNISSEAVLLEPHGNQYTHLHSIFSSHSGVPTVIGVYHHERIWRGSDPEILRRVGDVTTMYKSTDPLEVSALLDKYGVDYIVINAVARELHGEKAGMTLESLSDPVFISKTVKIFKVNSQYAPNLSYYL